ncbi:MAG: biotin transporter BioY [Microbacteriaceae bacterium]
MSISIAQRPTIVDRVIPRSVATDVVLIALGVALIAGAAQVTIPMYPVPMTGQTFAVLLVSMSLGFTRGTIANIAYVTIGALGAPIFQAGASGWSFGPTLGYLIGFVAAAAVVGSLAERGWDKSWLRVGAAFLAGSAVIYVFGLAWLSIFLGAVGAPNDLLSTLSAGLVPFIYGDVAKAIAAAALLPLAWAGVKAFKK